MLTLALPTGRSLETCTALLLEGGLPAEPLLRPGRNLEFRCGEFRYLLAKPTDVPTLVHFGAADLGFGGTDVILESGAELLELLDTGEGRCRMAVAGPPSLAERFCGHESERMGLRVATKYPRTAEREFSDRGIQVRTVPLHGSVEIAPALGLADCILDIVQTGTTLKANGLVVLEEFFPVSLRLVSSLAASQLAWRALEDVTDRIAGACERRRRP